MIITPNFYTFLVGAHAAGWCLVAHRARKKGVVDICQFVRAFIFGPILLAMVTFLIFVAGAFIWVVFLPNIIKISEIAATIMGALSIFGALGYFVITPAVKKAHGIAKPFSEKICIILYRAKK